MQISSSPCPWPKDVAKPAQRALAAAGITSLHQLTTVIKKELSQLHGMGPKALSSLESELRSMGLSFKSVEIK
jgi:hypothetical protein